MTAFQKRFQRRCRLLQYRRLRHRPRGCGTGTEHHLHGRVRPVVPPSMRHTVATVTASPLALWATGGSLTARCG